MNESSFRTVLALGVMALATVEIGCGMCTEIGCTTAITAVVSIAGGVAPLEGAAARVCRGDQCVTTGFEVNLDQASCKGAGNEDFFVGCSVFADGAIFFTVDLVDPDAPDEEAYSFSVNAKDGSGLGAVSGVVVYEKSEINGDGCGYCYEGSL